MPQPDNKQQRMASLQQSLSVEHNLSFGNLNLKQVISAGALLNISLIRGQSLVGLGFQHSDCEAMWGKPTEGDTNREGEIRRISF